ncbi:MAG: ABC transporter ATP-binding protein [Anaerolineae bacterium]|nr:ABC transporter ATP-binding protein [Anaerolineae bacterium]
MRDIAISVEKLSKRYHIGSLKQSETMAEATLHAVTGPVRRTLKLLRGQYTGAAELDDAFWALKDISFQVKEGEVVGIIGRNGAGKSTLLKLLSRITYPTTGRIKMLGRVGSLLEVGTGFHPELTGRENVFLNGAVLGMTKHEIDRKFDEIVAFSGVERFIDTPVKHYSSGMSVRLAFAVAAHLEPEILLVDEVLAVGDVEFQKKCLGKMSSVALAGRTVLYVSHNLATVQSLCSRAILLDQGQMKLDDTVDATISQYMANIEKDSDTTALNVRTDRIGGEEFRLENVEFLDSETLLPTHTLLSGQSVCIRISFNCLKPEGFRDVAIAIAFSNIRGSFLFACRSDAVGTSFEAHQGRSAVICRFDKWPLSSGRYIYSIRAYSRDSDIDGVKEAGYIDTELGDYYGTGKLPGSALQGVFVDYSYEDALVQPHSAG